MTISSIHRHALLRALVAPLLLCGTLNAAEPAILVRSGEKIGFMGDSITAQGNAPDGYIGLVIFGLKVEGVIATAIPAGVPGHAAGNMVGRVGPQILDKGAAWMTLSCGVNDVLIRRKNGKDVDLPTFKKNVTAMVEAALAKKVGVVLMTPTPLGEDLDSENNKLLAPFVDFMREYAKEKRIPLADVNARFQEHLTAGPGPEAGSAPGARLLADGVHPNKTGQALMAQAVLVALGVPAEDLAKIEQAQRDNPIGKGIKISGHGVVRVSPNQYAALAKLAATRKVPLAGMIGDLWTEALTAAGVGADAQPTLAQQDAAQSKLTALVDAFIAANGKP